MFGRKRRAAERFRRFARERRIDLDPLDGARIDVERLAPLDPALEGKRIVFLGESQHFIQEKCEYRLLLLRYLHSRGFRVLGEEIAWSDGRRIDRFLESGDHGELDRVGTFGYRGAERSDRDDSPTGYLASTFGSFPEEAMRTAHVGFLEALRRVGRGEDRFHFFGFDVDYNPALGYEEVDRLLREVDTAAAASLRAGLERVPGESLAEEITRLGRFEESVEARGGALGPELRRCARTLHRSHEYVRQAHSAPTLEALRPAMAYRERLMHEHVDHVLARLPEGSRVVLMAHDAHLAKDDARIRSPGASVGPGGDRVPAVGTHVARTHGEDDVYAVWMLDSNPRRTLNALLSDVGAVFLLPTASADPGAELLRGEARLAWMGGQVRTVVADQADAIFYLREVTSWGRV